MPEIRVKDVTLERYKAVRARLRQKLGTARVTQSLLIMNEDAMHAFANDLLELFDIVDPILDR